MDSVLKIYPTADECKTNNFVKCNEDGCSSVFTSESNLRLHLVKSHKKNHLLQPDVVKQYYCPNLNCVYNTTKSFKNLKCLRQHYLKVHTLKEFNCDSCKKSFCTETLLKNHVDYCGIQFKCCDCDVFYPCYETLKTHGRRKKHIILNKAEYKPKEIVADPSTTTTVVVDANYPLILPKPCIGVQYVVTMTNRIVDQSVQTDGEKPKLRNIMTQVNRDVIGANQSTQQTQTGSKNVQLTAETQTMGAFTRKPSLTDILDESVNRKSIKTQTNEVLSRSTSCNTSFNLNDFEFSMTENVEKNSSSTQTGDYGINIFSTATTTHDTIHTETSDLLSGSLADNLGNFDSPFFNCNMETQTDFMLQDDLFNCCDYYSNMYTQTCDEVLSGLGFNDTETQTVVDEMLRSVEIQTTMSHTKKNFVSSQDVANTETQTDVVLQEMLEEINS